ncbi:MAG: hypothetical protein M0042_09365 [Nitrospiraceae bacterium]|nr:hypothetical protein [Nitrospiraceae bacterium]
MPKLSDIKIKAVILGAVVDNAGTILLMTILAALLVKSGLTEDEVMLRMKSNDGLLLGLILGMGCTVGGALLAGVMAKEAEILHGALVAAIGMVLSIVFHESGDPLWFQIAGFVAILPAGVFGGYLAKKRHASPPGQVG